MQATGVSEQDSLLFTTLLNLKMTVFFPGGADVLFRTGLAVSLAEYSMYVWTSDFDTAHKQELDY